MKLTLSRKRCPGEAQRVDVVSPGKGPSCPAGSGTKALGGRWWLGCGRVISVLTLKSECANVCVIEEMLQG